MIYLHKNVVAIEYSYTKRGKIYAWHFLHLLSGAPSWGTLQDGANSSEGKEDSP